MHQRSQLPNRLAVTAVSPGSIEANSADSINSPDFLAGMLVVRATNCLAFQHHPFTHQIFMQQCLSQGLNPSHVYGAVFPPQLAVL